MRESDRIYGRLLIAPEGIEIYYDQTKLTPEKLTLNRTRRNWNGE